jgi:hypothetical protein
LYQNGPETDADGGDGASTVAAAAREEEGLEAYVKGLSSRRGGEGEA